MTWIFSWPHTGDGVARDALEFWMNDEFNPTARGSLKVPARSLTETSYTLITGDVIRLRRVVGAVVIGRSGRKRRARE